MKLIELVKDGILDESVVQQKFGLSAEELKKGFIRKVDSSLKISVRHGNYQPVV